MKILLKILIFFLILPVLAQAQGRSKQALQTRLEKSVFKAWLGVGFHFNEKAPNSVRVDGQVLKPRKFAARELEIPNIPDKFKLATAALYVCDDAVTFCETHNISLQGTSTGKAKSVSENKDRGRTNEHGFVQDDLNQAIKKAKAEKKLVLIDFAARWCPPCIRLENEIFGLREFKAATKNYVKVRLDADRFENRVVSEKFQVSGIPTLLVITPDQEEVDRLVDYQPLGLFQEFFGSISEDSTPIGKLVAKARESQDETFLIRAGKRLYGANKFSESLEAFAKVKVKPKEYLFAKVEAAAKASKSDESQKANYIETLKSAIGEDPKSSRALTWRTELVSLVPKAEAMAIANEGAQFADKMLLDSKVLKAAAETDQVGEFTGFERLMIAMRAAELLEEAGMPEAEKAWQRAADVGSELQISAKTRGMAVRFLTVLSKAKRYEKSEELTTALLKAVPDDAEIERRQLRIWLELKKYPQAIALGEKCLKNSFGRNEFWVAETLAKVYVANDQKAKARGLIERYLGRTEIDLPSLKSTKESFVALLEKAK